MNIIFAGTPDIAASCLQTLLDSEHNVIAVYTQPDRPKGRGKKLQASPVKNLALKHNITVLQPQTLKTPDAVKAIANFQADIMVVVAYGLILPEEILQTPTYGCINVHTSLLPKYRGPAPVQQAILNDDKETGVTIMQMDAGLDTGGILQQQTCAISNEDTTQTLLHKLAKIGGEALLNTLKQMHQIKPAPQDESAASYAAKISKSDAEINWSQTAQQIACTIRAYQPWPVAFSHIEDTRIRFFDASVVNSANQETPGEIIAVNTDSIDIACGNKLLRVKTLQLPGKKPMPAHEIINGHPNLFTPGTCFYANH